MFQMLTRRGPPDRARHPPPHSPARRVARQPAGGSRYRHAVQSARRHVVGLLTVASTGWDLGVFAHPCRGAVASLSYAVWRHTVSRDVGRAAGPLELSVTTCLL